MKNRIKDNYVLFFSILVFILFFINHSLIHLGTNDDVWFLHMAKTTNLLDYLIMRYNNWTSRIVIEAILLTVIKLPAIVWITLDSLIFVLIYYSMVKILNGQKILLINIFIFALLIQFPFNYYKSAGWYATTINYAWPLGFGLYSLSYISIFSDKTHVEWPKYFLLVIGLLIATSQEQMCALLLGFYLIAFIYTWFRDKKLDKNMLAVILFTLVILCVHGLCPGNNLRKLAEMPRFYPEYKNFGLMDKCVLGIFSTFSYLLAHFSYIIFGFFVALCISAFLSKKVHVIVLSFIPLIGYYFSNLSLIYNKDGFISGLATRFLSNLPFIPYDKDLLKYAILVFVVIIVTLYVMYSTMSFKNFLIVFFILVAAMASRFILGFSASIFASKGRTFINLYMLFILADVKILFCCLPNNKKG